MKNRLASVTFCITSLPSSWENPYGFSILSLILSWSLAYCISQTCIRRGIVSAGGAGIVTDIAGVSRYLPACPCCGAFGSSSRKGCPMRGSVIL